MPALTQRVEHVQGAGRDTAQHPAGQSTPVRGGHCHLLVRRRAAESSGEGADGLLRAPPDEAVPPGRVVRGDERRRIDPDQERHLADHPDPLVVGAVDQGV